MEKTAVITQEFKYRWFDRVQRVNALKAEAGDVR